MVITIVSLGRLIRVD